MTIISLYRFVSVVLIILLIHIYNIEYEHLKSDKREIGNIVYTRKVNQPAASKIAEIELPNGYKRISAANNSFASYLRNLPLNVKDNTIYSFDGSVISTGGYHYAIIDIDIGNQDLQQCADAVMRLRAEFLYQQKQYSKIHFNFLSDGKPRYFTAYSPGNYSYKNFRKYLNYVFSYANSSSLHDEMLAVENVTGMQIGDCFVQKGKPIGHAVIVVDIAINEASGEKIFLLAQSYMPAQSIHILRNLHNQDLDPWYSSKLIGKLELPGWTFDKKDLRRFK